MAGLFEKFSATSETKKKNILPIYVKISQGLCFDKIVDYIKNKPEYYGLEASKDFFDICFNNNGFEISLLLSQDQDGGTCININVFGENKRGKTRRKLKEVREEFNNVLEKFK